MTARSSTPYRLSNDLTEAAKRLALPGQSARGVLDEALRLGLVEVERRRAAAEAVPR